MNTSGNGRPHRIVIHLSTQTELWYSTQVPFVGWRFPHRGEAFEVVSCRMDGSSYIVEAREIERRSLDEARRGKETHREIAENRRA